MPHMLLIVEPIGQREARGAERGQVVYQHMLDFTDELRRAGVLMTTSSLATAATRLAKPEGAAARVVDGPFAEAKEMVGGFFLLDVATREQALKWAVRCAARPRPGPLLGCARPGPATADGPVVSPRVVQQLSNCRPAIRRVDERKQITMRFMIIIKATADTEAGVMPPASLLAEMGAFHEELARAGVLLDGAGLKASSHGWRVCIDGDGQRRIADGPFTESKELIAGYTLIQVRSREIEVRQLFEAEDFASNAP
jgi:hypothetical protein